MYIHIYIYIHIKMYMDIYKCVCLYIYKFADRCIYVCKCLFVCWYDQQYCQCIWHRIVLRVGACHESVRYIYLNLCI